MKKELVILSGKGGTGKTSVSASFAALSSQAVLVDCDVEASNLAMLLQSEPIAAEDFVGGRIPQKDESLCTACGLCRDLCRFDAIDEELEIDPFACEACGLCARVCPEDAIEMVPHVTGEIFLSATPHGPLVTSRLGIGEEYGGRLISELKTRARRLASERGIDLIIADGPPGIGCPVISTVSGADLALLVTEPSVSGLHDLRRVWEVTEHFGVPSLVAVNKYDLDLDKLREIERYCAAKRIEVVGWIPFDGAVVRALVQGRPPVEGEIGPASLAIRDLWEVVREHLHLPSPTRTEQSSPAEMTGLDPVARLRRRAR
jgi:MinD superfamily P-loop ATPase